MSNIELTIPANRSEGERNTYKAFFKQLEAENEKLKASTKIFEVMVKSFQESDKIVQDYIKARIKVIESRASRKDWEAYGDAWDALRKLKHE